MAPTVPPEPLNPRQWQVARLVAKGLSNHQIGERLALSPEMVTAHVERTLAKLGFQSRAQLAAWVLQHEG